MSRFLTASFRSSLRTLQTRRHTERQQVLRSGTIQTEEVREALTEQLNTIVDAVRTTLERCPPELAADLVDRGIVLAGGGALLRGLDQLLHEQTGLPIHIAEDPLSAVAEGTGKALQELDFFTNVTDAED